MAAHEIMLGTGHPQPDPREQDRQMYSAIQTGQQHGHAPRSTRMADLVRRNVSLARRGSHEGQVPRKLPGNRQRTEASSPPHGTRPGIKFVNDLLRLMVSPGGSDLFLTADFPARHEGRRQVTKVSPQPLTGAHTLALRAR